MEATGLEWSLCLKSGHRGALDLQGGSQTEQVLQCQNHFPGQIQPVPIPTHTYPIASDSQPPFPSLKKKSRKTERAEVWGQSHNGSIAYVRYSALHTHCFAYKRQLLGQSS